ncbi:uncharacterized protein LOC125335079 [Corvus hawaiiensis]|uniref:uncharacterized protein LOC125335079 n=1 Tax=Corvus hawaiiensis TaxID=134902 RepID=UPI002019F98B|nr:uncharacterized protein LOC125335079 [Corvus hawaiiensis]
MWEWETRGIFQSWQGQGACVGRERLDEEKRKTATPQEEKLELLERLRELERGSRALLEQRLRVLHRLHGLLQRDKVETLRQLQEALEQDRAAGSVRREHLPSRPREPAGPGRAGGSPAVGTPPAAPWGHGRRPSSAVGPGSSPAALGRALHVLRGLRQQLQRRLGQWQSVEGALGAAAQRKERQREHPHPASSPSLSSSPEVQQHGRGSPGLLHHVQHHFQELQLEKTQNTGNPTVLGGQLGTRGREEGQAQPGVGTPPLPQPRC